MLAVDGSKLLLPDSDEALCNELLKLLPVVETDMTIFFRQLALVNSHLELSQSIAHAIEQLTDDYKQ